jgi:hypothetical protein
MRDYFLSLPQGDEAGIFNTYHSGEVIREGYIPSGNKQINNNACDVDSSNLGYQFKLLQSPQHILIRIRISALLFSMPPPIPSTNTPFSSTSTLLPLPNPLPLHTALKIHPLRLPKSLICCTVQESAAQFDSLSSAGAKLVCFQCFVAHCLSRVGCCWLVS